MSREGDPDRGLQAIPEPALRAQGSARTSARLLDEVAAGLLFVATGAADPRVIAFNQRFVEMWRIDGAALRSFEEVRRYIAGRTQGGSLACAATDETSTLELDDGRVFELSSRPQLAADRVIGRVWSFRDVTAQRRA